MLHALNVKGKSILPKDESMNKNQTILFASWIGFIIGSNTMLLLLFKDYDITLMQSISVTIFAILIWLQIDRR